MASVMVKAATSDKLKEMDWAKNIEICEFVAQDPGYVAIPYSPRFLVWNHWLASNVATLLVESSDNEFDVDTIFS